MASWVRIETTRMSRRAIDDRAVLQLAEVMLFSGAANVALGQEVLVSNSQDETPAAWHQDHLVDGFMPYLVNSAKGGRSVAYISAVAAQPEFEVDLGEEKTVSEIHLHTVEQGDTVPQAHPGTYGLPQRLQVFGATREDFSDGILLQEIFNDGRTGYEPVIMRRVPDTRLRYLSVRGENGVNPAAVLPEQLRLGFAEIGVFEKGENVAMGRPVSANHEPNSAGRKLEALTDGLNLYGEIPPLRDWLEGLALRHDLETEIPLVSAELERRYSLQKSRLSIMTWIAAVSAAAVGFVILTEKMRRVKQADQIRRRIAANLHDELGADLHAIGLLGDHAVEILDSPEELAGTVRRIRSLSLETGAAARHCTNMLESGVGGGDFLAEMRRVASRLMADMDYSFTVEGEEHLGCLKSRRRIDLMLFHKECLANAMRHSGASNVRTHLVATPKSIRLEVTDDGDGLPNPEKVPDSLRRRAKLMRAVVQSECPPGGGTRILLSLGFGMFQWKL